MYKILLAGAVISTVMLVQAKTETTTPKNDKVEAVVATNNNESLKKAFEKTKKDFIDHEHASTLIKQSMNDMALIPTESNIKDFPAPLAATENDTAKIAAYYKSVADVYQKETKTAQEAMTRAHEASNKTKMDQTLKAQRHADIKLPHDINTHKDGHGTGDKVVPYKSTQVTPKAIHSDTQTLQNKRFNELKTSHDKLEMKQKFYAAIATELTPKTATVKSEK